MRLTAEHEVEFSAFVEAHGRELLRRAWLLAADREAGEDLFQQVLVKAAGEWPRLRTGNPAAYCNTALTTTAIDAARRRRWREVLTSRLPEHAAYSDALEDRDEVFRMLRGLPVRQRAVLVLRYYGDLSEAEIAQELGISTGTVKSTASKALAALRAHHTAGAEHD